MPLFSSTNLINNCEPEKIKAIIPKKILKNDQEACKSILKKIVNEKEFEELEKQWHSLNREQIRQKFIERHEKNISLEIKAGIKKEYKHVETSKSPQSRFKETVDID